LRFIKSKSSATPKEITKFIGFGSPAVFRQLKKLQNKKLIYKTGKPPKVFYYLAMDKNKQMVQNVFNWNASPAKEIPETREYSQTRDVFQARHNKLAKELERETGNTTLAYLLSAAVGEIGNNSFDHNFGNWPDIPGVYCEINLKEKIICLADRGNGVFYTIGRVRPEINDDVGALRVAFTEIVSGRPKENRGNGLKFVRRVIGECKLKLKFYSGNALCAIDEAKIEFKLSDTKVRGTIAIINF